MHLFEHRLMYVPHLIFITVFNDLCAQVAAANCSQILLVALAVA